MKVILHKDTDESMTYGFVRFQNPNDALYAMSELNGREICGKRIKVGFARRGIDTTNCKLYVKRVPQSYSLDDIQKLFSQVLFFLFLSLSISLFVTNCLFVCLFVSLERF